MIHPPEMTNSTARIIAKVIVRRWYNAGYRNIKLIGGVWYPSKEYCNIFDTVGCVAHCLMNGVEYRPAKDGLPRPVIEKVA